MTPYYEHAGITLYLGDCRDVLPGLGADSVDCCVTSPPYWGLRDYGTAAQIGLEESPTAYVAQMVTVFQEVQRVIKGTLWLNLGDSYNAAGRVGHGTRVGFKQGTNRASAAKVDSNRPSDETLKPKDLIGVPWRVAFALQAAGWYLRSDIIWSKPNPMPESVTDRPTKAHEYLFLMAKSERYHYDAEVIKEPAICGDPRKPYAPGQVDARGNGHDRNGGKIRPSVALRSLADEGRNSFRAVEDWRNKRSVWTVPTQAYPDAHFATFPEDLVKPCILAGCPPGGIVLDPFGGAGTTAFVGKALGCRAVLIELNERYCEIVAKRLAQDVLPLAGEDAPAIQSPTPQQEPKKGTEGGQ